MQYFFASYLISYRHNAIPNTMPVYPYSSIYQYHHWHYLIIYKEEAAIYHLHQWLACYFHRTHISVILYSPLRESFLLI
nr:MAG TPA: hypothetical protein [Caudoviricetes sp.]